MFLLSRPVLFYKQHCKSCCEIFSKDGLKIHEFINQKFRTRAFCHQLLRENIFISLEFLAFAHIIFVEYTYLNHI